MLPFLIGSFGVLWLKYEEIHNLFEKKLFEVHSFCKLTLFKTINHD